MEREEQQRLLMRQSLERAVEREKEKQASCKHLQGGGLVNVGSGYKGEYKTRPHQVGLPGTSIVWHRFRDRTWRGFCTECLRWFNPEDYDYYYWRSQLSGNIPSESDDGVWKPVSKEEYAEGIQGQEHKW